VGHAYLGNTSNVVAAHTGLQAGVLKSRAFWTQLYWIRMDPLGGIMTTLVAVAFLFLAGRFVLLLIQWGVKVFVRNLLVKNIEDPQRRHGPSLQKLSSNPKGSFPAEGLLRQLDRIPLKPLLHPIQRLRLMLTNTVGVLSGEEMKEKERRIVEIDWQLLYSSWAPFRWVLWLLPLFAMAQTSWLFYTQFESTLSGQTEVHDILGLILTSLLPLVQVIVISLILSFGSGLIKRLESLYLSNVDALFYDQFLSRLPFQSHDTLIILEALQRHFQEMNAVLKRLDPVSTTDEDKGR